MAVELGRQLSIGVNRTTGLTSQDGVLHLGNYSSVAGNASGQLWLQANVGYAAGGAATALMNGGAAEIDIVTGSGAGFNGFNLYTATSVTGGVAFTWTTTASIRDDSVYFKPRFLSIGTIRKDNSYSGFDSVLSLGAQATANTYTNHLELKLNGAYDGTNNKYITSAAFVNLDILASASNNSSGFDFYISQPGTTGNNITTSVATVSLRDNKANINTLLQFNNGTGNVQLNNISNSVGILAISSSGYNSIGEIEVTPDTSTTFRSYVRASSVYKPLYLAGSTISLSPSGTAQLTMDGSTVAVTVPFKMPNVTMASVTTYGGIWGKNVTPDITNYGVLVHDSGNDTYLQGLTSANLNVAGVNRLLLNTTDITASLPLTVLNAKMGHSAYYSSTDWARFGHSAMDNAGGYGFMQYVDGQVLISAPTGKTASLSINNVGQVVCDGVNVNMSVPLILPAGLSQLKFGNGTCNIGCWTRNATDDSVQVSVGAAGVFIFACDTAIAGAAVLTTLQYNYVDWSTTTTTLQKFSLCRHTGGVNTVATLPTGAAIGYETQICNTVNFTCGVQAGGAEIIINAGGSPHYIPYNAVYRYLKVSANAWVITAKSP